MAEFDQQRQFGLGGLQSPTEGPTLASAATLAPTHRKHFVSGTTAIVNITLPYDETPGNESYRYDRLNEVIFWDVQTGEQLFTQNVSNYFSHVWWNPDGNRALAHVFGAGYYLIVPAERIAVPIVFQDTDQGRLPLYIRTYWDH